MEKSKRSGFKTLTDVKKAIRILSSLNIKEKEAKEIETWDGLGKVLAEDVRATKNIPPFTRPAMDGFAVKAKETKGASYSSPKVLELVGNIDAGETFSRTMGSGETVQISTGARLPQGANAVVRVEYAEREKTYVRIFRAVATGKDVSRKGEDVKAGQTIVQKGRRLTPYDLSLLASIQKFKVTVKAPPRVGILACGDELINPKALADEAAELPEGRIVESNGIMLRGLLRRAGAHPVDFGIVRDDEKEISERITTTSKEVDLLLTVGGTSVGSKDLLPTVIENIESGEVKFHGINVMPGKPLLLSTVKAAPVVSLPGYPVSTAIDFLLFVKPLISKFLGIIREPMSCSIPAVLTRRVPSKPGTVHFVRVALERKGSDIYATPISTHGAGVLTTLVRADGFLIVPKDVEGFEKDTKVRAFPLERMSGEVIEQVL